MRNFAVVRFRGLIACHRLPRGERRPLHGGRLSLRDEASDALQASEWLAHAPLSQRAGAGDALVDCPHGRALLTGIGIIRCLVLHSSGFSSMVMASRPICS